MALLDEIVQTIAQRDTDENIVYQDVVVSPQTARELNHDDRVEKLYYDRNKYISLGMKIKKKNSVEARANNYYLKTPVCSLCGSKTFLNEDTGQYYCPVHYNE